MSIEKSLEAEFFSFALPNFLEKNLSSLKECSTSTESLGSLDFKMFLLCHKGMTRSAFCEIFLSKLCTILFAIENELSYNPHNYEMLKNYCRVQFHIWRLIDEITIREKKDESKSFEEIESELGAGNDFKKRFWNLKLESELICPGQMEDNLIFALKELGDSQRITKRFRIRMRVLLDDNDFTPIEKFMGMLGEKVPKAEPVIQNSLEKTKSVITTSCENPSQTSTPMSTFSQKQAHSQFCLPKNTKLNGLGRTMRMGHPMHFKAKKEYKPKEIIEYVDEKDEMGQN